MSWNDQFADDFYDEEYAMELFKIEYFKYQFPNDYDNSNFYLALISSIFNQYNVSFLLFSFERLE